MNMSFANSCMDYFVDSEIAHTASREDDAPVIDDRRQVARADDIAVFSHFPIDLNAHAHERALSIGLFNGDDKLVEILNFELP